MRLENKISVVINTYQAEAHLAEVLESVKTFDEVVICDMESTDNTVEIAHRHGARVVTFPNAGYKSAEPARTFAIQSATSPWVLVVDADEIVPLSLRDYLYHRIAEPDCPQGLYIPRRNFFMGQEQHSFWPDFQLRFFVREGTIWPPYVHTFPQVQGRVDHLPRKQELAFFHLANDSLSTIMKKTDSYTDNEVDKRISRNYGLGALLGRPLWRFLRNYFLKGGWRDGLPGLIHAGMTAVYQFVLVAKCIERKRKC